MSFPKITRIASHHGFWLKEYLLEQKNRVRDVFNTLLPQDQSALLEGITLGIQNDFSKTQKADMVQSGTTHLVALSGYNIAILVLVVRRILRRFFTRRGSLYGTTIAIILFVLMVGASASVVRAAIMGILLLLAREKGRLYDARNAIAFTALLMVLFLPNIVRFDVGFQLSFASLLGLIYLEPVLKQTLFAEFIRKESALDWRENCVTTIAAQCAVLPILLMAFGQASILGVVANTLILPFVPITMLLGFMLAGIGLISATLGFILAQGVSLLLSYELWVIHFCASIPFTLSIPFSPILFAIVCYGAIGLFISHIHARTQSTI
jgi:competence protein ComEC